MSGLAMQTLTIKLRLRDKYDAELNRQARAVNDTWNYVNETSRKAWQRDRRWLSRFDFQKLTAGASKELDLHSHTIQRVCHQFTYSRDKAKRAGIRWRGRKSLGWVPFNQGHVTIVGPGKIKFRDVIYETMHWREMPEGAVIRASSFNADSKGRWYINLPIEVGCAEPRDASAVGVDLGLKDLATLSDGNKIETPRFYRKSEEALAAAQRARKTKRTRAIHRKAANRRKDFLHKASKAIAAEYGFIAVGDVSPSKLAQTRLAKSIHDAGWSDFKRMLSYKAMMHGGRMIEVCERNTSRTCSCCGVIPSSSPKGMGALRIRRWTCEACGVEHDRDVNAARNIARLGQQSLAGGARV